MKNKHLKYNRGVIRTMTLSTGGVSYQAEITHDYQTRRKSWPTVELAKAWIDSQQLTHQERIRPETPRELLDANDARSILGGVSLVDAARFYVEAHAQNSRQLGELVDEFLKEKKAAGMRTRTLYMAKSLLGFLKQRLGDNPARTVTPQQLREALEAGGFSPVTRDGYRRGWRAFFRWAKRSNYITLDPTDGLEKVRYDMPPPEIYTPDEASDLIAAAQRRRPDMVPYLALGLFAGLRASELLLIEWTDIRPDDLVVSAAASKTRHQRYVPLTPNLKVLLEPYRKTAGRVCPVWASWRDKWLTRVADEAKMSWRHNALRHSFGTYYSALHGAEETAKVMGNTVDVVVKHYRKLVDPSVAESFFSVGIRDKSGISPETAIAVSA